MKTFSANQNYKEAKGYSPYDALMEEVMEVMKGEASSLPEIQHKLKTEYANAFYHFRLTLLLSH